MNICEDVWDQHLEGRAQEFLSRPKKSFRFELVKLGFHMEAAGWDPSQEQQEVLFRLGEMLEWIHAGSLIIDDIQDDSSERRGAPAVHLCYGVPQAINLGNWMYFEAIEKLHSLPLSSEAKLRLVQCTHQSMRAAHLGQALDLGVNMLTHPIQHISEIVEHSHFHKSGALVAMALQLGAIVANARVNIEEIGRIGRELGMSLQRFDDIGNFKFHSSDPKALEDLRMGRPSWIWQFLAQHAQPELLHNFREAVLALPDKEMLEEFAYQTSIREKAYAEALTKHRGLEHRIDEYLKVNNSSLNFEAFKKMTERIANAY
jgi:Geranylgeranyl pyrophosphate synthase